MYSSCNCCREQGTLRVSQFEFTWKICLNFRSCVSLQSTKEALASYEEFRTHLSNNIVEHSWSEDDAGVSNERPQEVFHQVSENSGQSLEIPEEVETRDKSFRCSQCDFVCSRSDNLKMHMKRHTGENEKPYSCTQCDYSCSQSDNLKKHMRVHTGEKPYTCSQCDYSCSRSDHLKKHMRVHTGEKPYKCTQCDYSCSQSDHLKNHMRVHTGEKPYTCSQCDYSCSQSHHLKRHMTEHNGEKALHMHSM